MGDQLIYYYGLIISCCSFEYLTVIKFLLYKFTMYIYTAST